MTQNDKYHYGCELVVINNGNDYMNYDEKK